jgi:hypothetical protein
MQDLEDDMIHSKNKPVIVNKKLAEEIAKKEKSVNQKILETIDKRDGDKSEVIDSEGHRVTINHY